MSLEQTGKLLEETQATSTLEALIERVVETTAAHLNLSHLRIKPLVDAAVELDDVYGMQAVTLLGHCLPLTVCLFLPL